MRLFKVFISPHFKNHFWLFWLLFHGFYFSKGISSIKIIIDKISAKQLKKVEKTLEEMMKKFTEKNSGENSSEKVEMDDDLYVDFEEMEDNKN